MGTRTLRNTSSQWVSDERWFITLMLRTTSMPGVSIGIRTMLWRLCGSASGLVMPITMAILQRECSAPVMNHLRPLMT